MRLLTITALTLSTALSVGVPAYAQNEGVAQLEAEAGVPAGSMSTSDLYRLIRATRDNDDATVRFIKQKAGLVQEGSVDGAVVLVDEDGAAQLAGEAGVENGVYTVNELQRLIKAQRENDMNVIDFIMSGGDHEMTMKKSEVEQGEEQLAAELGVNPKLYTLQELAEMKTRKDQARQGG